MGDKAFILAGLLMGFLFSLMHGYTSPKRLLIGSLIGGLVGVCVLLFVLTFGYAFVPIHVK